MSKRQDDSCAIMIPTQQDHERADMADTLTLKHHATLVDQMAETLGLDLEEKVFEGQLDPAAVSDAVLRCTGCSNPEGCAVWMKAQEGLRPRSAPVMCRNGEVFDLLKSGKRV